MHHARDVEDARLLAAGEFARLLATYLPVVETRVFARVRDAGADDVVQEILFRLWRELAAGRSYPVPFRVVVHNVTGWLIKAHFQGQDVQLVPLPEEWEAVGEEGVELADDSWLEELLAGLPAGERAVLELRYLQGLEIGEIAARLRMERNAVDQALHRAHKRIGGMLDG